MTVTRFLVFIGLFLHTVAKQKENSYIVEQQSSKPNVTYTASWAVEITEGGEQMADTVAHRHGFRNLGKVCNKKARY